MRRIQSFLALFGVTIVMALLILVPRHARLQEQRGRVQALKTEVESMKTEIARLNMACEAEEKDPQCVERFARERMDWRRPGEIVFR